MMPCYRFFVLLASLVSGCATDPLDSPRTASEAEKIPKTVLTASAVGSGTSARSGPSAAELGRSDALRIEQRSVPVFHGAIQPVLRPISLAYAPTSSRWKLFTSEIVDAPGAASLSISTEGTIEARPLGTNVAIEMVVEKAFRDTSPEPGWRVGFVLSRAGNLVSVDLPNEPGVTRTVQERLALRHRRVQWISVVFAPFRSPAYRQGDVVQAIAIGNAQGHLGQTAARLAGSTSYEGRDAYVATIAGEFPAEIGGASLTYEYKGYWLIDRETGLTSLAETLQRITDRDSGQVRQQSYQTSRIEFR